MSIHLSMGDLEMIVDVLEPVQNLRDSVNMAARMARWDSRRRR